MLESGKRPRKMQQPKGVVRGAKWGAEDSTVSITIHSQTSLFLNDRRRWLLEW